jgi:hypothetical protein
VSEAGSTLGSLRQGRRENRRLFWALALSLAVHLLIWGGYESNRRTGWLDHWPLAARLQHALKLTRLLPAPAPTPKPEPEPQLAFVQVAQDDPEPPQKPKYVASANAHAANPDVAQNGDTPKLNGLQTDAFQAETARRTQRAKTQPQPELQPEPEQPKPLQPQSVLKRGDLDTGKPQDAQPQPEPPHPHRPRTLKEYAEQNHLAGVKMRQDGSVSRYADLASPDAKRTPFGDYDDKFIDAVRQKWYDLLDGEHFSGDCQGRVTLHFNLNYDGTITDIKFADRSVDMHYAYLCQQALTEPAPFDKWPEEMRREIGGNQREMTFTFFYYSN